MTIPLPTLARDERGLLQGVTYPFRADSSVDWRRMIPHEFLVIQKTYEEDLVRKHGKPAAEIDRSLVEDRQLLILLGGIKRLLFYRGYTSLIQRCDSITPEKAVYTCIITFTGNYETGMTPVVYSDTASASYSNTSGDIPQMFLEATAANRALVRCVRGFLNINIAGQDEIGPAIFKKNGAIPVGTTVSSMTEEVASTPIGFQAKDTLARKCQEIGLTFEMLKLGASKYGAELTSKPEEWKSFDDVAPRDAFVILDKIAKSKEEAKVARGMGKKTAT